MRIFSSVRAAAATSAAGALFIASALFVPGHTALPVAQAAEIGSCAGSAQWGLKQTFRKYIDNGVAKGSWELTDGAGFSGTADAADAYFEFPVKPSGYSRDGDAITLSFDGTLQFLGHKGILDMTFSDWKVRLEGDEVEILTDVASKEFNMDTHEVGGEISGDDVVLATGTLSTPISADANTFDLSSGNVAITEAGASYFGAYEAGAELDPLGGVVDCSGTGTPVSTSTGTSSSGSGTDLVNNLATMFGDLNKMMTNSIKMIENSEKLGKMVTGNDGTSATSASAASGTTSGTSKTTTSNTSATSGTTSGEGTSASNGTGTTSGANGAVTNSADTQAGAVTQEVCEVSDIAPVVASNLAWGVKESFQTYIRGSIAKGGWTLTGMDFDGNDFVWTGGGGEVDVANKRGSIKSSGTVEFTGHGGILDLVISDLEIYFNGNSGQLIATVTSNDMDGNANDYGRTALADLSFSNLTVTDTSISGSTSSVALSASGVQAFAEFYEEGLELDPVTFSGTLGDPETACTTTTIGGSGVSSSSGTRSTSAGTNAAAIARATGGTSSTSGTSASTRTSGTSSSTGSTSTMDSDNANSGSFRIKNTAATANNQTQAASLLNSAVDFRTAVLLLLAAFVVSGTSLGQFIFRNPVQK
ncbi:MAG: HtaA domain-containing protein [Corynebacterium sp.]|nr:HtaA domain-containing protein [Corynebacterium sp.]